jgi:hypothetical protein
MTRPLTLGLLLLSTSFTFASTLAVYQDKTLYTYTQENTYLGMTKNVSAKCEGATVETFTSLSCPESQRLCKIFSEVEEAQHKVNTLAYNAETLEKLLTLAQPDKIDASSWIDAAKRIAEEKATLHRKEKIANADLKIKNSLFKKQAVSMSLLSEKVCDSDLELSLPYGYVSFSTSYEAVLQSDKEVKVTQNLSILNRSGIDIQADEATFYYRAAKQYLSVIDFNPWIVSKVEPRSKRRMVKKKAMADAMIEENLLMMSAKVAPTPIRKISASYVDAREYKINHLTLPSTGVPLDVKVFSWTTAMDCSLKAYSYLNTNAFEVCTFTPKHQIESNLWKIKSDKTIINDRGVGRYHKGKYELYTKKDEDIQIVRESIVKNERETGIFGTTVHKKDGYVLTLTNKSDKPKTLTLIDRIPTSSNEVIKVKLLSINSKKKIEYTSDKEGKIEMNLKFTAGERKKIEILFEIVYDKELKVKY